VLYLCRMVTPYYMQHCTIRDWQQVQTIGHATYLPYYRHVWQRGGLEWYLELCFGEQSLAEQLNTPDIYYFLPHTQQEQQPIALLKLRHPSPIPDTPDAVSALCLEKIYLMPDFYRQGWGQRLMDWVFDYARKNNYEWVWLNVMHSSPAEQAYTKAGFERFKPIRFDYEQLLPQEREGWLMRKRL
jgi:diamine N-acetyltransferase